MQQINSSKYPVLFRGRKPSFTRTSFFGFALVVTLFLLSLSLAASAGLFLSHATPAAAVTTVPTKMNFQGRLTDSTGNIKPNGTYNMKLRLYTVASAGSAVWSEDRLVSATQGVTITNGLFSIQLGSITSLPASLFASGPLYLEVELPTPATATSSTPTWTEGAMSPRNQMATSAYAYNAETLDGLDSSAFATATGGAGYIQNQTASPQTAGFWIAGGGTIDDLVVNSTLYVGGDLTTDGNIHANSDTFLAYGEISQLAVTYNMSVTNTTTNAVRIQDASSNVLLNADTTNMKLSIGSATNSTAARLNIEGQMTWTARTAAQANSWGSVTYGNGLFVTVSSDGTNRVMTSLDGITWTARTAAQANIWMSVTYGNGLFVAVSLDGTNRVMTSPDGITWTARTAAQANSWQSVTYGNGLFVAVSTSGTNRVMTSPDGITWTARTAAQANSWYAVIYGNGLFVATSSDGTNQVMTSPDGITWTARTAAQANSWESVAYGNGLFVAVSFDGTNRVMTSSGLEAMSTNGNVTVSGSLNASGAVQVKSTSTTAFQVQNAAGTGILSVDSANKYISVNGGALTYTRPAIGAGQFSLNTSQGGSYAVTSSVDIATADFNNDGYSDVATVGSTTMSVLINNGGNGFNSKVDYVSNNNAKIATGDFNADGKYDVLSYGNNASSLFLGNGDGTFQAKINTVTLTLNVGHTYYYDVADFNNDGKTDIGRADYDGTNINMGTYISSGSGFNAYTGTALATSGGVGIAIGDFNSDNKKDIITCENNASGAKIGYGNGTGGIASFGNLSYGGSGLGSCEDIGAGDFNGDGMDDIAIANWYNDTVTYAYRTGVSTFGTTQTIALPTYSGSGTYVLETVDMNADGKTDIVLQDGGTIQKLHILISATTTFTMYDYTTIPYSATRAYGDVNGDGFNDVVLGSSPTTVATYLNSTAPASPAETSTGTFSITTASASSGGLYIRGSASQTASLFTIQNSAGQSLLSVDKTGNLRIKGAFVGGLGSPDYAELITASDPSIQAADVVSMDLANSEHIVKSSHPYETTAVGVISTNPGFVTNATAPDATDDTQRPLALSGRVPVKVTNENGSIQPGDYLTTSSTPGHAMKATQAGQVIGRAMESFDGETGKVLMFIDNSYYNPYDAQHMQGSDGIYTNMAISGLLTTKELAVTGNARIEGSLVVIGSIETGDITVNGHVVTRGSAPTITDGLALGTNTPTAVTVDGTDSAGTISFTAGIEQRSTGILAHITFAKAFDTSYKAALTPMNDNATDLRVYLVKTPSGFDLVTRDVPQAGITYMFDYVVVGARASN